MEQISTPIENEEYYAALTAVRRAKNCLWWVIALSIIIQLAAFVSVRFVGVVDDAPQLAGVAQAGDERATTAPATALDDKTAAAAWMWHQALNWVLPATKFIAMAAGILLVLTMLMAVQMSLVGRTGGAAGFTSGFFWSLLLLVFLVPWQQIVNSTFACGALYNFGDLIDWTAQVTWNAKDVSLTKQIFYYDRFIGYPVFVLLLCLAVQVKFACGWRQADIGVIKADLDKPVNQNDRL